VERETEETPAFWGRKRNENHPFKKKGNRGWYHFTVRKKGDMGERGVALTGQLQHPFTIKQISQQVKNPFQEGDK